jgi:HSP20 family protein
MAETEIQSNHNDSGDKAAASARRAASASAEAGRQTARAGADTAEAGLDAERRSFSAAGDATRQGAQALGQAAQTSLKAGQELARTGREAARRASDQASDFWRASLTPMTQLHNEFGRWVEQMWRQAAPVRLQGASPFAGMILAPFTGQPLADLHETDQALELCVELPGLKPEDIALSLQGDILTVSGEKSEESERDDGAFRVSERRFGRFERTFPLPPEADRGKIDASFRDGLLKVTIAKSARAAEAKTIPIKG